MYLGAAPGVGKSHAMVEEGVRRAGRGADVVIGILESTGRQSVEDLASSLERAPTVEGSNATAELDITALQQRRPQVVLVDDLAHRVDDHTGRWDAVEELLAHGLDVITTVNISNLESMSDIVATITGSASTETVPDSIVRAADQIELVDMSPEALRRRLAHGHLYPPDRVDTALANVFRPEVLGKLRQLSLLWLADRVEEQLERQLLDDPDETRGVRERVVVALGGQGGDHLVRRAARIAGRTGAHLVGVHVVSPGKAPGLDLERQRGLLVGLGGVYREIVGDNVAEALAAFARVEQATQLVIGAVPRDITSPRPGSGAGSVVDELIDQIGTVDVHVVATDVVGVAPEPRATARTGPARPPRMRAAAWTLCVLGLPLLTAILATVRRHVSVGSALMFDLCLVMAVAALGGLRAGLVASVAAFGLTNWFLTPPLHTVTVGDAQNVVALSVFVLVTVVVSFLVDRAARRSREAASARAEAAALARSAATLVGAHDPLPDLLEQLRATFGLASASVFELTGQGWWPTQVSGHPELLEPSEGTSIDISSDGKLRLVVSDNALRPEQLEVLRAFADQLAMAVEARRLRVDAANADLLSEANALRAALLQAVSHDFRTPLATIKASASGLLHTDVAFSDSDRRLLLVDIDDAADRLDRMVRDLLDMSRLQVGALDLTLSSVALEEVVAAALGGLPAAPGRVEVDVADSLPMVLADAALLERAVANLVSNALAWSPDGSAVKIQAGQIGDSIDLRVVDRGPGISQDDRERIFLPFQRLGDRSNDAGVGLGLAIARGFIEAMGARLSLDDTPGGGLTMTIRLQTADEVES
ncbi:MAG: two-component system, OmpR family, sensor histidine kinase KdpD [Ilumatobacteraceae bacterium]